LTDYSTLIDPFNQSINQSINQSSNQLTS